MISKLKCVLELCKYNFFCYMPCSFVTDTDRLLLLKGTMLNLCCVYMDFEFIVVPFA